MKSFAGRLAVVTGGGSGIGRALVRRLAREGCSVAILDLNPGPAAETAELALAGAPAGVRVTAHTANVADEDSLVAAREQIRAQHGTDHINLLFNNAGIAGAGSFVTSDREAWERVFDICWRGVYLGTRTFLPLLIASDEGYIVNTASINAVWPKHGKGNPSTSYGAAKYAVKGFSEALIEDLRTHAPHVKVAVVMPGGVTTNLGENSSKVIGAGHWPQSDDRRSALLGLGAPVEKASDEQLRRVEESAVGAYRDLGYTITVEDAAATILGGVHDGRWRIITGIDAQRLDRLVREDPEAAFDEGGTSLTPPWIFLLVTLRALLGERAAGHSRSYAFRFGEDEPIGIRVDGQEVTFLAAPDAAPDVTLALEPHVFRQLILHERSVSDAVGAGALTVTGDRDAAESLFAAVAPMAGAE